MLACGLMASSSSTHRRPWSSQPRSPQLTAFEAEHPGIVRALIEDDICESHAFLVPPCEEMREGVTDPQIVMEGVDDFFGPEHVMFGSDTPFDVSGGQYFTSETIRSIEAMRITQSVRNDILSANAVRNLRIG